MNPAAAEAPAGSHQVFATKKYVLAKVISQITTSNASPIPQSSRRYLSATDHARPFLRCQLPRPTAQSFIRRRVYHSRLRILQPSYSQNSAAPQSTHTEITSADTTCSRPTIPPTEILISPLNIGPAYTKE